MSRKRAFSVVVLAYALAIICAYITAAFLEQMCYGIVAALAVADIVCTLVVFLFTWTFKNTSIYDPYWSVLPPLLAAYALDEFDLRNLAVLILLWLWGIRLTWNWVRRWKGLQDIDWRYVDYQKKTGRWFWLVSFLGLQMVPTIIVFLACLPVFTSFGREGEELGIIGITGILMAIFAIWLEYRSDNELHDYLKSKNENFGIKGVWSLWRFPNYVGEVMFWWAIFLLCIEANPSNWWIVVGPVVMTALFQFISMPLMEKRHRTKRPEYWVELMKRPRWIPKFPHSGKE